MRSSHLFHPDADTRFVDSASTPTQVCFRVEGDTCGAIFFLTPEKAREAAKVLLAGADRAEAYAAILAKAAA